MIGRRTSLGLAVSERRIVAAELASAGGRRSVMRAGQFVLPDGVAWDAPQEVGERLGAWLRKQGMGGAAVVGVPASWLVTAGHEVPPVDPEALRGLLRLAAERAFPLPADKMACDYATAPPEGQAGTALLIGARRDRVEACAQAARAAGLKLRAVTSTGATLALAGPDGRDSVTAQITPDGIELVLLREGRPGAFRHLHAPGAGAAAAARALELGIRSVLDTAAGAPQRVNIYDALSTDADALSEAAGRAGLEVVHDPTAFADGLAGAAEKAGLPVGQVAPAAALAVAGLDRSLMAFDLTRPRLARRPVHHWGRWAARAAVLVLACAAGGVAVVADRGARKAEIADLKARLNELQPSIAAAQSVVDTVNMARGWYDRRPPFLDCLLNLTRAFPEEGRIWATSLAVQEDMRGVLSGKSVDERSVLEVLDGLTASAAFAEAKLLYMRETRAAAGDTAFAIAFTYAEAE